jgi:hypothetical protein
MSKTLTGFRLPHCLAPVVGGGGCLVAGLFSVNRSFRILFWTAAKPKSGAKTALGPPRGFPLKSVAIRLELGTILISRRTSSTFWAPAVSLEVVRGPSGRRVSIRGGPMRQQRLQKNLAAQGVSSPVTWSGPALPRPRLVRGRRAGAGQFPTRSCETQGFAAANLIEARAFETAS